MNKKAQTVVGFALVVLGVVLHAGMTIYLHERVVWDVVALTPMLIGAHLMSSSFLKEIVAGIRARFKGGDE